MDFEEKQIGVKSINLWKKTEVYALTIIIMFAFSVVFLSIYLLYISQYCGIRCNRSLVVIQG